MKIIGLEIMEFESLTTQEFDEKYKGYLTIRPRIDYWKEEEAHGRPITIIRARDLRHEIEQQFVENVFFIGSRKKTGNAQWVVEEEECMGYYFLWPLVEEKSAHKNARLAQIFSFGQLNQNKDIMLIRPQTHEEGGIRLVANDNGR